jgi:hypothetical protein
MDDYDLKAMLSELTLYAQAQVFYAVLWRWLRRPRRRWIVDSADVHIIG